MKQSTLVGISLLCILVVAGYLGCRMIQLIGSTMAERSKEPEPIPEGLSEPEMVDAMGRHGVYKVQISTFTWDGHLWVKLSSGHNGGLSHHPDCPCMLNEPEGE